MIQLTTKTSSPNLWILPSGNHAQCWKMSKLICQIFSTRKPKAFIVLQLLPLKCMRSQTTCQTRKDSRREVKVVSTSKKLQVSHLLKPAISTRMALLSFAQRFRFWYVCHLSWQFSFYFLCSSFLCLLIFH